MRLIPDKVGYPRIVVFEGEVYDSNLKHLGYNRDWLNKKMKEKKVSLKDLFVLIVDESGGIFFQEKRKGQ